MRRRRAAEAYLSKREQQIMEMVYQRERVTAAELTELLPGDAGNSTIRTLLRILEEKGKIRHEVQRGRYVYMAAESSLESAKTVLRDVTRTFFNGSVGEVVVALLAEDGHKLTEDEWERLEQAIHQARREVK
jgi:BlaI family penicillinase repressor